mmetsp:Transcript_40893/g.87826  ORF Transcript_40893/g.87826 Transcript_40893/m.87826 type:complete len:581 (-) Transcript_40893:94-1836(-)
MRFTISSAAFALAAAVVASAERSDESDVARALDELESFEALEAEALKVELLQTKFSREVSSLPLAALVATSEIDDEGEVEQLEAEVVSALQVSEKTALRKANASTEVTTEKEALQTEQRENQTQQQQQQQEQQAEAKKDVSRPLSNASADMASTEVQHEPQVLMSVTIGDHLIAGIDATAKSLSETEALVASSVESTLGVSMDSFQGAIPMAALMVGMVLTQTEYRTIGLLSVYFGVQTGLNLYMKIVLSNTVISTRLGLKGIPGAFLITAMQQLVSFCMLVPALLILWPTRFRYTPKPLKSGKAWAGVCGLSVTFALNIGLNNMCLSLLPMSINLMIRSCIPLAAWAMQTLVSKLIPGFAPATSRSSELILIILGALFAAVASLAKEAGGHSGNASEEKGYVAGLIIGCMSLVACSLYLIFAQWLGKDLKMNPIDMTLYMSVPAALFLLPLMSMSHPVGWKGYDTLNDWQVLHEVLTYAPHALILVALSGFFAVCYNTLQYTMVSELSATHTAFAGNFNKAATIVMSLVLGLESLPPRPWDFVTIASITGGIAAFTAYSVVREAGARAASAEAPPAGKP